MKRKGSDIHIYFPGVVPSAHCSEQKYQVQAGRPLPPLQNRGDEADTVAVPIQSLKRLWTSQKSCFLNKWHELARFQHSILATLAPENHQPTSNSKHKWGAPHHRAKAWRIKRRKDMVLSNCPLPPANTNIVDILLMCSSFLLY